MARNRSFRFLSWNVRGLNDRRKCSVVKSLILNYRCSVICLQETKLNFVNTSKFYTFCGSHLQDFRCLNAIGTRGGLLTAWNPSLFDCVDEWSGNFSLNVLLKRKVDDTVILISNIYGPNCYTLKADFFYELRYINSRAGEVWAALGDFNVLLSVHDKNKTTVNIPEILQFRELLNDIGLLDVPLLNRFFTWSNGRHIPTLERLDCALISNGWRIKFPNSALRALPRPTSDYSPLLLSAYTFIPAASIFRFETFWLRYPTSDEIIANAWKQDLPGLDAASRLAAKLHNVQGALKSWSSGLNSAIKRQSLLCLQWILWLDKAEELRNITELESLLRLQLVTRYEELCQQEELKWKQRSRVQWLKADDANTKFFHLKASGRRNKNFISHLSDGNAMFSSHDDIADHLLSFFQHQLGKEGTPPMPSTFPSCITLNLWPFWTFSCLFRN